MSPGRHLLTIIDERSGLDHRVSCPSGTILREVLLEEGITPYTALANKVHCGGRGICATCGVHIHQSTRPRHWHDWLASRFGYPRLSCQILVTEDLRVTIPKKWLWGKRRKRP